MAAAGVCLLSPVTANAVSITSLKLAMDGSADPPGDRIDLNLAFLPDEKDAALEVRPYASPNKPGALMAPVRAAGERNRDAGGMFLFKLDVKRPASSSVAAISVVVPYGDLSLAGGTYRLVYEVKAQCRGRAPWIQASPVTLVTVSDTTRRLLSQPIVSHKDVAETYSSQAFAPGEKERGGETRLQQWSIQVTTKSQVAVPSLRPRKVEIPGEFARQDPAQGEPSSPPGWKPEAFDLAALRHQPWLPLSAVRSPRDRLVYFATNRQRDLTAKGPFQFKAERAPDLTWGTCLVNVPVLHHRKGTVEGFDLAPEKRKPERHFLVESVDVLTKTDFLRQVQADDVVVFVHGYRSPFERAVLRIAQVCYDIDFRGRPMVFSWPSAGELSAYEQDKRMAGESAAALADVFSDLTDALAQSSANVKPGRRPRVHVIAHSMGNAVFLGAVSELERRGKLKPGRKVFGQVVLAAPDVDPQAFNRAVPTVVDCSDQVTYYFCRSDRMLMLSQQVNRYAPVGLYPLFEQGLDTIGADGPAVAILDPNHDYYATSHVVLEDMRLAIGDGLPPAKRMPPLQSRCELLGHTYWSFAVTTVRATEQ